MFGGRRGVQALSLRACRLLAPVVEFRASAFRLIASDRPSVVYGRSAAAARPAGGPSGNETPRPVGKLGFRTRGAHFCVVGMSKAKRLRALTRVCRGVL